MELPRIDFSHWMAPIWDVVRWFLKLNQPWLMIVVALAVVYGIVSIILSLFYKDDERNDDERDYDYEEY